MTYIYLLSPPQVPLWVVFGLAPGRKIEKTKKRKNEKTRKRENENTRKQKKRQKKKHVPRRFVVFSFSRFFRFLVFFVFSICSFVRCCVLSFFHSFRFFVFSSGSQSKNHPEEDFGKDCHLFKRCAQVIPPKST